MSKKFGFAGAFAAAGAFCLGIAAPAVSHAQSVRNDRLDIHPLGDQVGIITRVIGTSAWTLLPQRVKLGAKVEITAYSDGGDVLAAGSVAWIPPTAPYEVYLTGIKTVKTRHRVNEHDGDDFTIASIFRTTKAYGSRPFSDANGSSIAIGFFARAAVDQSPLPADASVEPVRANIAALYAQKTRIARAIADAAEKALTLDPLMSEEEQPADYAVNFSQLEDNLRPYHRLQIGDPVTEQLLTRLLRLASDSGTAGAAVSEDFLRPASQLNTGIGGSGTVR